MGISYFNMFTSLSRNFKCNITYCCCFSFLAVFSVYGIFLCVNRNYRESEMNHNGEIMGLKLLLLLLFSFMIIYLFRMLGLWEESL